MSTEKERKKERKKEGGIDRERERSRMETVVTLIDMFLDNLAKPTNLIVFDNVAFTFS